MISLNLTHILKSQKDVFPSASQQGPLDLRGVFDGPLAFVIREAKVGAFQEPLPVLSSSSSCGRIWLLGNPHQGQEEKEQGSFVVFTLICLV